jgi:predicted Zn-dependent protease
LKYSSPEIPEGINYSREHPLKEFIVLVGGVVALFLAVILVLSVMAESLVEYIPFSAEQRIIALQPPAVAAETSPVQSYLQKLANQLAEAEHLAGGMSVQIHYVDDDTVNAFATLGGQIIVFRGLLENMPHENALAMVIAHEVAHIKYRHPLRSLGRAVVIGTAVAMFSSSAANDIVSHVFGKAGMLTVLKYNREQEHQADMAALQALQQVYGHVDGAMELFQLLQQQSLGRSLHQPEFFASHPLTENRITTLHQHAQKQGWDLHGKRMGLPAEFHDWIDADSG